MPVIRAWPTTVGVYATLHVPDTREHVVELKVPVLFEVKEIEPVGATAVPAEVSVTVAVQVEAWLSGTLAGAQTTLVAVVLTVNVYDTDVELLAPVAVAETSSESV